MFLWEDYLTLARYLIRSASISGTEEAAQRSAVSRAYYAAFCRVRAWAAGHPSSPFLVTGRAEDHRGLGVWLRRSGYGAQAQDLERLRVWRNRCDYDGVVNQSLDIVCQQAVNTARQTLDSLGIR